MGGTLRIKLPNRPNTPSIKIVANTRFETHAPKRTEKLRVKSYTMADAPDELMILCIIEDKARNFARSVICNHVQKWDEYRTNAKIKGYADLILDVCARHESEVLKTLSMDEQIKFADLCDQYDEQLDQLVADMERALSNHLLACPKARREHYARVLIACYVACVCAVWQSKIRVYNKFIYKLNGRLVDSVALAGIYDKLDRIATEIWHGDVDICNINSYETLDVEFCRRITDTEFFNRAALAAGFTQYADK